jgi:hypothetical protein
MQSESSCFTLPGFSLLEAFGSIVISQLGRICSRLIQSESSCFALLGFNLLKAFGSIVIAVNACFSKSF